MEQGGDATGVGIRRQKGGYTAQHCSHSSRCLDAGPVFVYSDHDTCCVPATDGRIELLKRAVNLTWGTGHRGWSGQLRTTAAPRRAVIIFPYCLGAAHVPAYSLSFRRLQWLARARARARCGAHLDFRMRADRCAP